MPAIGLGIVALFISRAYLDVPCSRNSHQGLIITTKYNLIRMSDNKAKALVADVNAYRKLVVYPNLP